MDDIAQIGERGAAGIELLNYFNYGGEQGPPPKEIDWNVYGFATEAYRETLESALKATKQNGLIMDFSMGPQSGQGVPAEPDDIGLSWELVTFNVSLENGYSGLIPGWGSGDFISLSSLQVLNASTIPSWTRPASNKTQYIISGPSLIDLSSIVTPDGYLNISNGSLNGTSSDYLMASYARRSYAHANIASNQNPQNILQKGSFAVDHFSVEGAKLTTSFLENYVIQSNSTIRSLLKDVGQYIWEDSPEIPTGTYWTPELPKIFQEQHGYDIRRYLPLLVGFNGDLMLNDPPISIISGVPELSRFVDDFRTTLTKSYKEYLAYIRDWSESYLNMQFSAQVGYNLPVDMLSAIPVVDAAETETLAFLNNIDAFRQFSGPAHLLGRKTVSLELGADYGQAYSQPLVSLIEAASRAYAVGINQVVIHGAAYSGPYAQTTYPGFTTFGYLFGAQHSRHQPAWNLGYGAALDWLARAQHVLHSGTPKVDIVFWNKQTAQDPFPESLYMDFDLTRAGYSYTYLSPDNFESSEVIVRDNILAPDTIGARALVLRENDTLTVRGVQRLFEYANAGLPIIFQGVIPQRYSDGALPEITMANSTLHSMTNLSNVYQLKSGGNHFGSSPHLASFLASLNVHPRTKLDTNGTWYTRYIHSPTNSTTSIFVFSDTPTATRGTITISAPGVPYLLDLWNGKDTRILEYAFDQKGGRLSIPIEMAPKQAIVIQFRSKEPGHDEEQIVSQPIHIAKSAENILGYDYDYSTQSIFAKIRRSSRTGLITLSNGTTVSVNSSASSVPRKFSLSNWTLVAEKWIPPSDLLNIDGVIKQNVTIELIGAQIPEWPSLPGLQNSSGIGIYSTTFDWVSALNTMGSSGLGGLLRIPASKWIQGMMIFVNQQDLPVMDLFNPTIDISQYLRTGCNNISISVSTTLWNSLRPIWEDLRTGGQGPQLSIETLLANPQTAVLGGDLPVGLVGTVTIVPYRRLKVA